MAHDREVAGIRCLEVLEHLSGYVDGELEAALAERIRRHLDGCDWCERFGGRLGEVVGDLRQLLGAADPVPEDVRDRLLQRLLDDEPRT